MVCSPQAEASGEGQVGLRPVLMDFGLARDSLGPQRLTQTGVVMGTPHYMAPEQARGQARHLDRRADVYSLGAILYEMLTGRPPFDAEHEVDLLLAVLHQDPLPPRQLEPSVPVDLEVITLKCLRKEPEHRYDSALALADDLSRYLRSEPILARPASTLYRIRRLAMRHRALVGVAAVLLFALCGVVGVIWRAKAHERRDAVRADERQRLAADLGQTITKLRLFMRIAYSLPPHSLAHEQELVRGHLQQLQLQLASADPFLHGTFESAIGQGYLALDEYKPAVEHLMRAVELGERASGVHISLGQALGGLYEQRAAEISRTSDVEQAKPELAKLRQELLVRARHELSLEQRTELMSAAYVRALLHFYSENPMAELDAALGEARQAQVEAPWLIEPFDLELKITMQRYIDNIKRGKSPTAAEFQSVHDAIERAIGIARSYPEFYASYTDYTVSRVKDMMLAAGNLVDVDRVMAEAIPLARTAILLQPQCGTAHDQLLELYTNWAYAQAWRHQDSTPILQQGFAVSRDALSLPPKRARTYMALSKLHLTEMMLREVHGEDTQAAAEQGLADAREAARMEPKSSDIRTLISVSLSNLLEMKRAKGITVDAESEEIISAGQRAMELRPDLPLPINNLAAMYIEVASDHINHGMDPTADIDRAKALGQKMQSQFPDYVLGQVLILNTDSIALRAQMAKGQDVIEPLQALLVRSEQALKQHPAYSYMQVQVAETYDLIFDSLMRHPGRLSPGPIFDEALAAVAAFSPAGAGPARLLVQRSNLLLRKANWLRSVHQSPEPLLNAMMAGIDGRQDLTGVPQYEFDMLRARASRIRGEWLRDQGRTAKALSAIEDGLLACAQAASSSPIGRFNVQLENGALLTLKAEIVQNPLERSQLAERAVALLDEALKIRIPLNFEFGTYLKTAQELTAKSKSSL